MSVELFQNKLVAVLNKSIEAGKAMNALAEHILLNDFTHTMTVGTYQEQIERTAQTKEDDLIYYGIVLFGDWAKVTELTKKCSLWR